MSEYDWRNPAAYAYMNEYDAEGFGYEYLRRNEYFYKEYMTASEDGEVNDAVASKWGIRFRSQKRPSHGTGAVDPRRLSPRASAASDDEEPTLVEQVNTTFTPVRGRLPRHRR
ncbi:transcriptional regulator domain-containing protein [Rhizobium puerariae]|uniref:Transcriptional regulator domain-containing protein n=1 Tax=Rhizobium puerariae TaxID=1585791 RepID=A0ABV6AE53_9HYPH